MRVAYSVKACALIGVGALIAREAGARVELPCPENADLVIAATDGIFDDLWAAVQFVAA